MNAPPKQADSAIANLSQRTSPNAATVTKPPTWCGAFLCILTNDRLAITAHDYATHAPEEALPDRLRDLLIMRATAAQQRKKAYQAGMTQFQNQERGRDVSVERHIGKSQHASADEGIEL